MEDQFTVVLVRGGDKDAPRIAQLAGMKYGIRHDYKAYGDVYMISRVIFQYRQCETIT